MTMISLEVTAQSLAVSKPPLGSDTFAIKSIYRGSSIVVEYSYGLVNNVDVQCIYIVVEFPTLAI